MKIKEAIARGEAVTGEEPFNYFLAVLFPSNQLLCMEYNRVVRDLAGFSVRRVHCLLWQVSTLFAPAEVAFCSFFYAIFTQFLPTTSVSEGH